MTPTASRSRIVLALTTLFLLAASASVGGAQSFYHRQVMKGRIVAASTTEIRFCIGTSGSVAMGQQLDVFRVRRATPIKGAMRVARRKVARIRIEEIVDQHYALATILKGTPRARDVVKIPKATDL